jgi:hypothetical protein
VVRNSALFNPGATLGLIPVRALLSISVRVLLNSKHNCTNCLREKIATATSGQHQLIPFKLLIIREMNNHRRTGYIFRGEGRKLSART